MPLCPPEIKNNEATEFTVPLVKLSIIQSKTTGKTYKMVLYKKPWNIRLSILKLEKLHIQGFFSTSLTFHIPVEISYLIFSQSIEVEKMNTEIYRKLSEPLARRF